MGSYTKRQRDYRTPRRPSYKRVGSMKRNIISNGPPIPFPRQPTGQDGRPVITTRWSGIPRKRSVARPALRRSPTAHLDPMRVGSIWCAATARLATSEDRSRIRRSSSCHGKYPTIISTFILFLRFPSATISPIVTTKNKYGMSVWSFPNISS